MRSDDGAMLTGARTPTLKLKGASSKTAIGSSPRENHSILTISPDVTRLLTHSHRQTGRGGGTRRRTGTPPRSLKAGTNSPRAPSTEPSFRVRMPAGLARGSRAGVASSSGGLTPQLLPGGLAGGASAPLAELAGSAASVEPAAGSSGAAASDCEVLQKSSKSLRDMRSGIACRGPPSLTAPPPPSLSVTPSARRMVSPSGGCRE
mmetsp:Transcript_15256/g.45024  ORF Transcript_15256/g.45024 Transcript_15256/m.45024 type:complete len:205 (+) Transcript_15256:943-1557(+)